MSQGSRIAVVALIVTVAGGGFLWWQRQRTPPPAPPPVAQPVAPEPPAPPDAPPPVPAEPVIQHPIERSQAAAEAPTLDTVDGYVKNALVDLLGKKAVLSFLSLDGIVSRFVGTVDNLEREHASIQMWPVKPTPGTFKTEARAEGTVISAINAARYAAFVRFAERADTRRLVALYVRLYPLFQQAYEDLGYPGMYFNDRVVAVIDHLLETPSVAEPIQVKLVQEEGADKPARVRELYQFQDPDLEARSAGQKILLRLGREHAETLKAKLGDIRRQIAKNAAVQKLSDD